MSSYLNIYAKFKDDSKEPLLLVSYTRSSEVYQYFEQEIHPIFMGTDEIKYTDLTFDNTGLVCDALISEIKKLSRRIEEYEKHAGGNLEIINEIISLKEYKEELKDALSECSFIKMLTGETQYAYTKYTLACNIG